MSNLRTFMLLCMFFIPKQLLALTISGIVTDAADGTPLANAIIVNISEGVSVTTDQRGYFHLAASPGSKLECNMPGYEKEVFSIDNRTFYTIKLKIKNIKLQEFVFKDLTRFQKDSIEMHKLYKEELERKSIKPQYTGLAVNNLFNSLAYAVSRKHKLNKRFKAEFNKDEQQKFIATRYTPQLAHTLTGLSGDTLAFFMNSYPMDYLFARRASDLELKMWIRDNYKRYKKELKAPATIASPDIKTP